MNAVEILKLAAAARAAEYDTEQQVEAMSAFWGAIEAELTDAERVDLERATFKADTDEIIAAALRAVGL